MAYSGSAIRRRDGRGRMTLALTNNRNSRLEIGTFKRPSGHLLPDSSATLRRQPFPNRVTSELSVIHLLVGFIGNRSQGTDPSGIHPRPSSKVARAARPGINQS